MSSFSNRVHRDTPENLDLSNGEDNWNWLHEVRSAILVTSGLGAFSVTVGTRLFGSGDQVALISILLGCVSGVLISYLLRFRS